VFSDGSVLRMYHEDQRNKRTSIGRICRQTEAVARERRGRRRIPNRFKSLRSNAELVVRQSPASKDVNAEAEKATVWEAVTRQPVNTQ
jgi:hypothetical protein